MLNGIKLCFDALKKRQKSDNKSDHRMWPFYEGRFGFRIAFGSTKKRKSVTAVPKIQRRTLPFMGRNFVHLPEPLIFFFCQGGFIFGCLLWFFWSQVVQFTTL
jgi:hypothetical protein